MDVSFEIVIKYIRKSGNIVYLPKTQTSLITCGECPFGFGAKVAGVKLSGVDTDINARSGLVSNRSQGSYEKFKHKKDEMMQPFTLLTSNPFWADNSTGTPVTGVHVLLEKVTN